MLFAEISAMLSELENDLDETQSLKLRLIEEEKRHRYTKKELEEIRRSSIVFSDSSSSGLFPDYDSNPSDESEAEVQRDEMREGEDCSLFQKEQTHGSHESFTLMLTDNEDFEWEHEDGWLKFGSADGLDTLCRRKIQNGLFDEPLRKSSSLGRLNGKQQRSRLARRSNKKCLQQRKNSHDSPDKGKRDEKERKSLEEKVAVLQKQLQDEKRRRDISEREVAKLQIEKEDLCIELEDTREQLRESQLNLFFEDDDEEPELCFDQSADENESLGSYGAETKDGAVLIDRRRQCSPSDNAMTSTHRSSPCLDKLQVQTEHLSRGRLTASWKSLNAHYYELDEYDDEINVELDAGNVLDTLRRLKIHTNALYNDALNERDELRYLKGIASRMQSR